MDTELLLWKSVSHLFYIDTSLIFKKLPKVNNKPNSRKVVQSDHPVGVYILVCTNTYDRFSPGGRFLTVYLSCAVFVLGYELSRVVPRYDFFLECFLNYVKNWNIFFQKKVSQSFEHCLCNCVSHGLSRFFISDHI
jgi:hypothetical protein